METNRFPVFSSRFLSLRGELNQAKFAEFLGISRTSVCLYESGARIPDALTLRKIAEKSHVSADWLLGLSDVRSTDGDMQQACNYTGLSEQTITKLGEYRYQTHYLTPHIAFSGIIDGLISDNSFSSFVFDIATALQMRLDQNEFHRQFVKAGGDPLDDETRTQLREAADILKRWDGGTYLTFENAETFYVRSAADELVSIIRRYIGKEAADHAQKE